MAIVVALIGVLASLFGIFALAAPNALLKFAASSGLSKSMPALYGSATVRLVFGALLAIAGPHCRPEQPWVGSTVRIIGVVVLVTVVLLMLLGSARLRAIAEWWLAQGPTFVRAHGLLALLLGIFFIYAGT